MCKKLLLFAGLFYNEAMLRWIIFLALANFLSGRLALLLAIPPGYITAIWPPVGLSLAAILLKGKRVLPGVWLGSFFINLSLKQSGVESFGDLLLPALIATGSSLAVYFAALMIKRFLGWPKLITGEWDVFRFLMLSGPLNAWISAGIGVLSLWGTGTIAFDQMGQSFLTWWMGDSIGGMLLTAPLIIMYQDKFRGEGYSMRRRWILIPMCTAIFFTVFVFLRVSDRQNQYIEQQLDLMCEHHMERVAAMLHHYEESVMEMQVRMEHINNIQTEYFEKYGQINRKNLPGFLSFQWAPLLSREKLKQWDADMASNWGHVVTLKDVINNHSTRVSMRDRSLFFPITFIDPLEGNELDLGIDLVSEPLKFTAINEALHSQKIISSGSMELHQHGQGLYVFSPVFIFENKNKELKGVLVSVIHYEKMFNEIFKEVFPNPVSSLTVVDHALNQNIYERKGEKGNISKIMSVFMFDREFQIEIFFHPDVYAALVNLDAWHVLVGGFCLSVFLAGLLMVIAGRSLEVDIMVKAKTKSLLDLNQQLLEEINLRIELEEGMRRATEKAEKANQSKTHFIARMSHEIRTPINGIQAPSQMILDQDDLSEDSRKLAQMILNSSQHLVSIIDDILDFSRMETGQVHESLIPLKLKEHVLGKLEKWNTFFNSKKLDFSLDVSELSDNFLWLDVRLLDAILDKLLDNCRKFTQEGKVSIQINEETVSDVDVRLEIIVSDTGIGMSEDFCKRMCDAFEQEDDSLTRRFEGIGLGLSLILRMVKIMSGELEVQSKLGEGTTITIRWPAMRCLKDDQEVHESL